jgi:alpha-tubulin suppressor-like RCC1 family protein
MNVTNLILELKSKINTTLDQQMVSKAIRQLELGAVFTVGSYSDLPSVSENAGQLYLIEFDGLYFSDGVFWIPIASSVKNEMWSWGCNNTSQIGDNSTINKSSPVSVVGGFTDWCQVSAGSSHSLAVRTNGTTWGWGRNYCGQVGDDSTIDRFSPVSVVGGFTDWCQVSAGGYHSLGLRTNGTAWAWGEGACGRLGDDSTINRSSPVSVVGGFTDWCQVSAGGAHSVGLRTNGTAWSWGCGSIGRLGDNSAIDRSSPVSVIGGFTDWCQVSAGGAHSVGLRTNGTLWAWGNGTIGRLGDNSTISRSSPVSVVGGFTDWCQVSAGGSHSLGVKTDGTAWAWGQSFNGNLGNGFNTNRSSPVSVIGGFTDWCQVSGGNNHSLGLRTNGTAWSWGSGGAGILGTNSVINRSSPVSVVGGFTDWCQVSAGNHSLAIRKYL